MIKFVSNIVHVQVAIIFWITSSLIKVSKCLGLFGLVTSILSYRKKVATQKTKDLDSENLVEGTLERKVNNLRKLENGADVRRSIETAKTLPRSWRKIKQIKLQKRFPNPLLKDSIIRKITTCLNKPGRDSYNVLKKASLVCQKWHKTISPELQLRSIINFNGENDLPHLLQAFPNTPQHLKRIFKTSLRINDSQWAESDSWVSFYKSKFIGLHLIRVLIPIQDLMAILEDFPNLEELTLQDVTLQDVPIPGSIIPIDSSESTMKVILKQITIIRSIVYSTTLTEAVIKVLLKLRQLETLSLHFYFRPHLTEFFSNLFSSVNKLEFLKHLKRLELKSTRYDKSSQLINQLGPYLKNLKELLIEVESARPILPFLTILRQKLEKLDLIHSKGLRMHDLRGEHSILPPMYKLKDFNFFYNGSYKELLLPVSSLIDLFPVLNSWTLAEVKHYESYSFLPCIPLIKDCDKALCNHAQQLIADEGMKGTFKNSTHDSLEEFKFFCSLRDDEILRKIALIFPNLKRVSVWIHSPFLKEYFFALKCLRLLEYMEIKLSQSIQDLPSAFNFHLGGFESLKECTLQKVSTRGSNELDRSSVILFNLDHINLGITECKPLKILSFKSFKIDKKQVESLRLKILANKPRLALNFMNCH